MTNIDIKKEVQKISIINNHIKSSDLFNGKKELKIIHNKEEYSLRITSNNKMILTK
jgi:hemin uptake protein HemP